LKGLPHTRFFGTHTYGASTSTQGFQMPHGANLVIATQKIADRSGTVYSSGLIPDVVVKYDEGAGRDDPLNAARNWLAQQPSCRR
jgi:C-terminal processing protease CtpA/Prc